MQGHDLTRSAAAVLVVAALALTPPAAFGCGWWGDSADESDDSVAVGPDGAPVEESESVDPGQMARLSAAYRQGDGVPRDLTLARRWARMAAEAGHAGAMNDLGQMLDEGLGGPRDEAAAARWYGEAARRGIAGAQHSLAAMLRDGRGVEGDLVAAEGWLRRSALQGHASAASDLSGMIWAGQVAARSPAEGCFWWLVASPERHQGAAERCREAQPALSDEALRAVQARAAAWTPGAQGSDVEPRQGGS
jgi:TPR repeat protein